MNGTMIQFYHWYTSADGNYWKEVNNVLSERFLKMPVNEWFQKHNAVSEVDFAKEPHRNKLNMVINRTNHLANHLGQLILLKARDTQD